MKAVDLYENFNNDHLKRIAHHQANVIDDPMHKIITCVLYGNLRDMNFRYMTFKFDDHNQLLSDGERMERAGYDVGINGNKLLVYMPAGFSC